MKTSWWLLLLAAVSFFIFTAPAGFSYAAGNSPIVLLDMLPLEFPEQPYIQDGTTMVPLRAIAESLDVKVEWEAQTQKAHCQKGSTRITLQMDSPVVEINGKTLTLSVRVQRIRNTMMVPLRVFSEAMGFTVLWDGDTSTVYIKSPKGPMSIWGFYALGSTAYSSWQDLFGEKYPYVSEDSPASLMEGIFLGWYTISDDGTITSSQNPTGFMKPDGWPAVLLQARVRGLKCFSMYYSLNSDGKLSALLSDAARRERLALSISVSAGEYDGILLDFEGLGAFLETQQEDAKNFNLFVDRLKELLGSKPLALALPPQNSVFKGYDHAHLGKVSQLIVVMAYDYQEPNRPTPVAPWDKVDEALRLEISSVPKEKILLGIPSYGVIYEIKADSAEVVSKPAAKDASFDDNSSPQVKTFSPSLSCEYTQFKKGDSLYQGFLESPRSLEARVNLAKRYGIKGVALWRLGLLPQGFWERVSQSIEPQRATP